MKNLIITNIITGALGKGDGGDEGHEVGAAEEFGDEEGGAGLGLRGFDPLQTRP